MSFIKATASAVLAFALAGAAISPAAAARLHKGRTHPHVTTELSNGMSSRAGAAQGSAIGGRAGAGVRSGGAGGTATVGAGSEGGGGMGGGMSAGGGM